MTKSALQSLIALFAILCCTTIAGAPLQESHPGAIGDKECIHEGDIRFLPDFNAPKTGGLLSWRKAGRGSRLHAPLKVDTAP